MASKKPRYAAVVRKGGFDVVSPLVREQLREKGYRAGDAVSLEIYKSRNPKFNSLAHVFGKLLADNIEDFSGMDSHDVLKRLQVEANIGCDEMMLRGEVGVFWHRVPRSLSFDNMDEGEFKRTFSGLARHVARKYWPAMTPAQIEQMAEMMPEEA